MRRILGRGSQDKGIAGAKGLRQERAWDLKFRKNSEESTTAGVRERGQEEDERGQRLGWGGKAWRPRGVQTFGISGPH